MATIGRELYATAVHEFFDGLRSYDVPRAMAVLADDADFVAPWTNGQLTGKEAIEASLTAHFSDPVTRPSMTISDISGDGSIVRLKVSVSGRFGESPKMVTFHCLHLKGLVHQVVIQ